MATLVGDMDEDITLIVVGPWELQHPRRRHLSSSEQTEPSVDEDSITVSHGLCALNFLRHCRRQHEEKAAASQETRSRAARLTPSQIQNRAIYPRWLGLVGRAGSSPANPEQRGNLQPPKASTLLARAKDLHREDSSLHSLSIWSVSSTSCMIRQAGKTH